MPPISEEDAWKRGLNKWNFWRDAAPYAAGFTYFGGLGIGSGAVADSIAGEIAGAEALGAETSAGLDIEQIPMIEMSSAPVESVNIEQLIMEQFMRENGIQVPNAVQAPVDTVVTVHSVADDIIVHSASDIIDSSNMAETNFTSTPEQMGARPKVTNRATQSKPPDIEKLTFDIEEDPQVDLADRIVSKKTTTNARGHDLMWERARTTTKTRSGKPFEYIEMQDVSDIIDPNAEPMESATYPRGDQPSTSQYENPVFDFDEFINEPFDVEMDELVQVSAQDSSVVGRQSGDSVLFDNNHFKVKMGERYGPDGFDVTFKTNEVRWIDGEPHAYVDGEWEPIRVPKSVMNTIHRYFPGYLPKPKPRPRPKPRPKPTPIPPKPKPKPKRKKKKVRSQLPRKCVKRDAHGRCIKHN